VRGKPAITIVLAMLGAFVAMLALTFGFVALYLCLEFKLGTIAALGILGGPLLRLKLTLAGGLRTFALCLSRMQCHLTRIRKIIIKITLRESSISAK
jgi:hypothetical protein